MKTTRTAQSGFTLIEVMIVVVIIGLLAAVGYPAYTDQLAKGKRAEGKAKLAQALQKLERSYTDNNVYTTDLGPLFGLAANAVVYSGSNNEATSAYRITAAAGSTGSINTSVAVTATVNGGFTDATCGNYTITNTGVKSITGSGTVAQCW
jgi:type IV pilus assembly protein PilE